MFEIDYDLESDVAPRRLAFRIVVEPREDGSAARRYVFDQRRTRNGWLAGEPGRVIYRPRKPLQHGTYRWSASAWTGVEWTLPAGYADLTVDAVPPAEVDGLVVAFDRDAGEVVLRWDPVAVDREGGPEYVVRYRVYRYERRDTKRRVRTYEAGVVTDPTFVDPVPADSQVRILYYRIAAEDAAGNVAEMPGR